MKCSFKAIGEEAQAVLDLAGIEHTGQEVEFPDDVVIGSDQGVCNQPSYYTYQVGKECFVYPLDTEVLAVE